VWENCTTHALSPKGARWKVQTIYRVVSPSGEPAVDKVALSPRLDSLEGKRIGFLWNRVFRGRRDAAPDR